MAKREYDIHTDFRSSNDVIKHDNHMPYTPLYRPGQERIYYKSNRDNDLIKDNDLEDELLPISLDLPSGRLEQDDRSPRFQVDPRYGSANGKKESSPIMNTGGQLNESSTERHGGARSNLANQMNDRSYIGSGQVTDPRRGGGHHGIGTGYSRLKNGGALLFIRFPTGSNPGKTENIAVASQAFLRSKTQDMGGKFLGIAYSVHAFGYPSGPKEAIAVYHFPNPDKAKLFFQYDPCIRQPDFPPPYGHAEMWIVCNAYLPDNLDEYNTFLLSEVMLHNGYSKREFFEVFQKPFETYLSSHNVQPFVICSYGPRDRESLRRHSYHHQAVVTCHLFKGIKHLKWLSDQDTYLKFRSLHNQMADERCMVFSLQRDLCP